MILSGINDKLEIETQQGGAVHAEQTMFKGSAALEPGGKMATGGANLLDKAGGYPKS